MTSDAPTALPLHHTGRVIVGALFLHMAVFAGGCASSYEMKVKAVAKPATTGTFSYRMVAANASEANTLRHREATAYVRSALAEKGLKESADAKSADLLITLDYGVGPPVSRPQLVSEPIYIYLPGRYRYERVQAGTDRNGNPVYQLVAVQEPPRTEFAGYSEYWITVTNYEKYLRLTAVENTIPPAGQSPAEIWDVDLRSDGESQDLRRALPILAAASADYVGKDTKGPKKIRFKDTDQSGAAVKKRT